MRNPTSQQVQTVIDNFKKVLPLAIRKGHLDMQEGRVNEIGHKCGTVHCHGGWYAIAACNTYSKTIDYAHGAEQMASDLGFTSKEALKEWAVENPSIWGNCWGNSMFSVDTAFSSKKAPVYAKTLADIIAHWEEVRDRLKILENQ